MSKKIAIMSTGESVVLDSVYKFLKQDGVEITCISDYLNSGILKAAKLMGLNEKYLPYEQNTEYFSSENFDLILIDGYEKELSEETLTLGKFVDIHQSLLPSFKGHDALRRAFVSGVKVSGVTISYISSDKSESAIIAQYPVLINNTDHFDDFQKNINGLEKVLVPRVVKSILDDTVFDYNDLFNVSCGSSCGGNCGNCSH
ncbi:MAG: hypothetical protein LKG27_05845 [Clostridiaceae bacterium]|jgi:phosphoribosylglycinamide formyltransferase 1|nr:hypothetical protein [Clostridiaceae bacterium]